MLSLRSRSRSRVSSRKGAIQLRYGWRRSESGENEGKDGQRRGKHVEWNESRRGNGRTSLVGKGGEVREGESYRNNDRVSVTERETSEERTHQEFANKGRNYESLGSSEKT